MCDMAVCLPPTDPGCTTYTMSVHNVAIHDDNSTEPIAIEKVTLGSSIRAKLTGKTSLKAVPVGGSYRVYSLQGQNVAAGPLDGALEISGGSFTLDVGFTASAALFNTNDKTRFEFAVDVFQAKSGSDEGMCVQVASTPYMNDMRAKASPPFNILCKDNGDGSFTGLPAPGKAMPVFPVVAPACQPPPPPPTPKCALEWYYCPRDPKTKTNYHIWTHNPRLYSPNRYYCPRDPGCATYTMSVGNVTVHTGDASGYKAGDQLTLHLTGKTTLQAFSDAGSYRIYSLSGKNAAAGNPNPHAFITMAL